MAARAQQSVTYRPQEGGGYVVFLDGDRIGWVRAVGREQWAATDTYMVAVRGYQPTRSAAAQILARRYRKAAS